MTFLVGLTGGIGSGKSTVADLFAAQGVRVIDTDQISHQLTGPSGAAIPAIQQKFGGQYIQTDSSLNRGLMRQTIFADAGAKRLLEAILHPLILAQAKAQSMQPSPAPYTLIVIPLLFENDHYADWLDHTIAVDCSEALQLSRTMQRNHLDESTVRAIMATQLDRDSRNRLADTTIQNDSDLAKLKEQVVGLHRRLSVLAAQSD